MTLNLANPSFQNHHFHFREPVNNLINVVEIDRGCQQEIGHGWSREQTRKVIEQLERYGARDAAEAHGAMGKFAGLLYRDIGQITSSEIEMAHEAEVQTREERSVKAATVSALAFDHSARKPSRDRPAARVTETIVKQDTAPGVKKAANPVDFSLSVDPNGRSDVKLPVT
jgi:hypothetical protein